MTNTERAENLCRRYLALMEGNDLSSLLALFTENATATSPISGSQPAHTFYRYVMEVTSDRAMALKTIFVGASNPARAAVHMTYTRSIKGQRPSTIECVDIFDLNADYSQFTGVTIIYDTAPVRAEFSDSAKE